MAEAHRERMAALGEIRDYVIMLSLGNAYLCEDPILIKIGQKIDSTIVRLREEIISLKKRFPGQFMQDVNTDEIIEDIEKTAQRLQEPDKEISEKCTVGQLGKTLEEKVNLLTGAVREIQMRVEGEGQVYGGKDMVSKHFVGLKYSIQNLVSLLVKVIVILAVIIILPLSYLFITMETEGKYQKKIVKEETYIRSQEKAVSELEFEEETLLRKLREYDSSTRRSKRLDEVEKIELEMKLREIRDNINQVKLDINAHQKKIGANKEKIEEIKNKTFYDRLLRH